MGRCPKPQQGNNFPALLIENAYICVFVLGFPLKTKKTPGKFRGLFLLDLFSWEIKHELRPELLFRR